MRRVNDGALLFLQTMLAKMKLYGQGASRIALIFNGSPLYNGDCQHQRCERNSEHTGHFHRAD
jgi:hypothetical protein